jgi:hypothetical protein
LVQTFIETNYEHLLGVSKKIISKNGRFDDPYELLNYCFLQLLEHEKRDQIVASGFGSFWVIRVMTNSIYSNTSGFHKMTRMDYDGLDNEMPENGNDWQETENTLNSIENILNKIEQNKIEGWYVVNMFRLWVENPNYNYISRETGIPRKSITNAVKTCRDLVLQELKKNKNNEL